ncbi:hypothetical protein PanWU01x14_355750 [Parasponia andersonii]|uniref:Uncharacterized protein n=1 Tax=Parasponia andersonii TaxID=3476 RepID=A0A2P5A951_PARAD|nr:hypothetical protein PanWU01x14_355750 [Parasponia andersonii]
MVCNVGLNGTSLASMVHLEFQIAAIHGHSYVDSMMLRHWEPSLVIGNLSCQTMINKEVQFVLNRKWMLFEIVLLIVNYLLYHTGNQFAWAKPSQGDCHV